MKLQPLRTLPVLLCLCLPLHSGLSGTLNGDPELPWKVSRYLGKYAYLANQLYLNTGIPRSITLAVAGLESNWGLSELALNGNNHFGIKVNDWNGPTYCVTTTEWSDNFGLQPQMQCFRKYPLIARSYEDFGNFLARGRYYPLFQYPTWDYNSWAWELQSAGYATDPGYAGKIVRLIEAYRLFEYDSL